MKAVDAQIKRGSAELAVLSVLCEGALHGYEIAKQIAEQTGGVLTFDMASLYPMLYRLEKRGWIRGEWETVKNGRQRRCYKLTGVGKAKPVPLRRQWKVFFHALDRLAGVSRA